MEVKRGLAASLLFLAMVIVFSSFAHSAQLTLAWNYNSEPEVTGYKIYYGESERNYYTVLDAGNIDHLTVDGLLTGKTYHFAATAYDGNGNESEYSLEVVWMIPAAAIIIEDGESAVDWIRMSGTGTASSVFDAGVSEFGSNVVVFGSSAQTTVTIYRIPLTGANISNNVVSWKFKYFQLTNTFFMVNLNTTAGSRNIYYRPIDTSTLGTSTNIYYGIGASLATDGQWHTITRNIQTDLKTAQPTNNVLSINYLYAYVCGFGQSIFLDELIVFSQEG